MWPSVWSDADREGPYRCWLDRISQWSIMTDPCLKSVFLAHKFDFQNSQLVNAIVDSGWLDSEEDYRSGSRNVSHQQVFLKTTLTRTDHTKHIIDSFRSFVRSLVCSLARSFVRFSFGVARTARQSTTVAQLNWCTEVCSSQDHDHNTEHICKQKCNDFKSDCTAK